MMGMPREPKASAAEYVTISIRLPKDLHAAAEKLAEEEMRSLSAIGVLAFRAYVAAARESSKKGR